MCMNVCMLNMHIRMYLTMFVFMCELGYFEGLQRLRPRLPRPRLPRTFQSSPSTRKVLHYRRGAQRPLFFNLRYFSLSLIMINKSCRRVRSQICSDTFTFFFLCSLTQLNFCSLCFTCCYMPYIFYSSLKDSKFFSSFFSFSFISFFSFFLSFYSY